MVSDIVTRLLSDKISARAPSRGVIAKNTQNTKSLGSRLCR